MVEVRRSGVLAVRCGLRSSRLLALALAACSVPAIDRGSISKALHERTGHTLAAPQAVDASTARTSPDGPAGELSAHDAVAHALHHNPLFAALLEDVDIARAMVRQASRPPNPLFFLYVELASNVVKPFFNFGLPIETGGAFMKRRKVAIAQLEQVAARLLDDALRLVADVHTAHARLRLLRSRERLTRETVTLLERAAKLTAERLRAGDIEGRALRIAEAEVAQAKIDLLRIDQETALARVDLDRLLGTNPASSAWQVTKELGGRPALPPDWSKLVADALQLRADVRAAELDAKTAAAREGLQWALVAPTVSLSAVGEHTSGGPFLAGPGISVPIPIFDQNLGNVERAESETRKALRLYRAAQHEAVIQLRRAFVTFERATAILKALEDELRPRLEKALAAAEAAAAIGQDSWLPALLARRDLIRARTAQADARFALHAAWLDLERAAGGRVSP